MRLRLSTLALLSVAGGTGAFVIPQPAANHGKPSSTARYSTSTKETSDMLREMREELARNEEANMIMNALRGQNLNDDDAQVAGLEMQLVDIMDDQGAVGDRLPYDYDPLYLKDFFGKRPGAVVTRFFQLSSVLGSFVFKTALDRIFNRLEGNPDLEVTRAAELRDKITSLGPFYIKVSTILRRDLMCVLCIKEERSQSHQERMYLQHLLTIGNNHVLY